MVTTIKITCDGVFIQTHSYRTNTTATSAIVAAAAVAAAATTSIASDQNNNANGRDMVESPDTMCTYNSHSERTNTTGNRGGAYSHSANCNGMLNDDDDDVTPKQPKNRHIEKFSMSAARSVSTLPSTKSNNRILINNDMTAYGRKYGRGGSGGGDGGGGVGAGDSSTMFGRIGRSDSKKQQTKTERDSGKCGKTIGSVNGNNGSATVRRRNTFKNYLIECKENLIRRLSSPTSPNGQ